MQSCCFDFAILCALALCVKLLTKKLSVHAKSRSPQRIRQWLGFRFPLRALRNPRRPLRLCRTFGMRPQRTRQSATQSNAERTEMSTVNNASRIKCFDAWYILPRLSSESQASRIQENSETHFARCWCATQLHEDCANCARDGEVLARLFPDPCAHRSALRRQHVKAVLR